MVAGVYAAVGAVADSAAVAAPGSAAVGAVAVGAAVDDAVAAVVDDAVGRTVAAAVDESSLYPGGRTAEDTGGIAGPDRKDRMVASDPLAACLYPEQRPTKARRYSVSV